MSRPARWWVGAFVLTLAVFGFGQLQAWPFTSWYMFSHVEPNPTVVARAVADGRVLDSSELPFGLVSHRLLQRVRASPAAVCSALRKAAPNASDIRVEQLSWNALERNGDRPANVTTEVLLRC